MPTRVVVVHDDPEFANPLAASLTKAGYEVTAFLDPSHALEAIEAAVSIADVDMLITRYLFGTPQPLGPSLARLARTAHPAMAVIFVARPEFKEDAKGLGEFIAAPAEIDDVVWAAVSLVAPESEYRRLA
jgi:DNA-binding response OmpR family regulator